MLGTDGGLVILVGIAVMLAGSKLNGGFFVKHPEVSLVIFVEASLYLR